MSEQKFSARVVDALLSAFEFAEDRRKAAIVLCVSLIVTVVCWYLWLSIHDVIAPQVSLPEIDARDTSDFNFRFYEAWTLLTILAPTLAAYAALNLIFKPIESAPVDPLEPFVGRLAAEARMARTRRILIVSAVVGVLNYMVLSLWGK